MATRARASISPEENAIDVFLEAVHRQVVELGVRDRLDVRRLLASRERWPRDQLRASLAALLARNAEELRQIEGLFDQHTGNAGDRAAGGREARRSDVLGGAAERTPARAGRLLLWQERLSAPVTWSAVLVPLLLFVVVGALVVTAAIALGDRPSTAAAVSVPEPPPPPPLPEATATPVPELPELDIASTSWELVQLAPQRTIEHVAPASHRALDPYDALAMLPAGVCFFLGIRWWMLLGAVRARRKREVEARLSAVRAARREAAKASAERGDAMHLAYHVPSHLPLPTAVLDDSATLLGRVFGERPGTDLEVGATLRETLREGGRFVPVYDARRTPRGLLVLIDVERGDHPWLAGFSRVIERIARQGVPMTCYRFQYDPVWVVPASGGRAIRVEDLSRRHAGAALVIFSRRLSAHTRTGPASWTAELGAWPLKAWIDPDPRPPGARGAGYDDGTELVQRGLLRFPWTEVGWLALARYLESGGVAASNVPWPSLPRLEDPAVEEAVASWALCAALVPDATWPQLEAIRRHPAFEDIGRTLSAPWHLQSLLDWTARQTGQDPESGDGRTLDLTPELVERLLREGRRRARSAPVHATLEARARRLLLEQLDPERPEGALQRLRWELKEASHRMVLEPERAYGIIARFFGTAVEEETREVLNAELDRQREGLGLGGTRIHWTAVQRLRALEGADGSVTGSELLSGHGQVTARAAVAALGLTLLTAALVVLALHNGDVMDQALGTPSTTIRAVLPPIYEARPVSRAPAATGADPTESGSGKDP